MEKKGRKKISRREFLKVAGATGATITLGNFLKSEAFSAPKEVVIGCIFPMTGAFGRIGVDNKYAIEAAIGVINNKTNFDLPLAKTEGLPNLGGAKVRYILADSQGSPEKGLSEAERLISVDKVTALFGCWNSGVTNTASQVAERMEVPFLCPDSSAPVLTQRGFKWFWRTSPNDINFTKAQFDFVKDFSRTKKIPIKKIGLFYDDTLFGSDSSRIQREMNKEAQFEIVSDIRFKVKSTSLVSEVQLLKQKDPDVLFITAMTVDAILFVKTSKELDYNPKMIISQGGTLDPDFLKTVGGDAEGQISRTAFSEDLFTKNPLTGKINQIYKKQHPQGLDIYDYPARAFMGFIILCDAINRAGSTEPQAIQKAMRATNIPASELIFPWDGVRFGPDGQNQLGKAYMVQLQKGVNYSVWPWNLATKSLIYPIPKWSERK
jgi:branched-chain amino acid transport system substrate-binding protein